MPSQRIDKLGVNGFNSDILPALLDPAAWTSSINVRSADGAIRPFYGKKKLFDLTIQPVYHSAFKAGDGAQFLIYSDGRQVFAASVTDIPIYGGEETPTETEITPLSGVWSEGLVTFTVLNGILVVNSESNGPFYWAGGATELEALPGWQSGWTCRQIVAWREHLVALSLRENGVEYPHKYRGSTAAGPGEIPTEWIPAPDNYAFTGILADTMGQIIGGVVIKDSLWVIKEDAVCFIDWVGGDFIAVPRRSIGNIGTQLIKGFVEMNGALVLMSTQDLWLFDGVNIRSLVDQRVRSAFMANVANDKWSLAQLHAAESYTLLVVQGCTSGLDRHDYALALDVQENTWSVLNLTYGYGIDNSLVTFVEGGAGQGEDLWETDELPWTDWVEVIWQRSVYSPSTPIQVFYESNPEDTEWWVAATVPFSWTNTDGSAQYCMVERIGVPLQGTPNRAAMGPFWFDMETVVPVRIWIGGMQNQGDAPRWKGPFVFTPGQPPVIRTRVTGRYLCWRLETIEAGAWRLGSITLNWEAEGER